MSEEEILNKDLSEITAEEYHQLSLDSRGKLQRRFRDTYREDIFKLLDDDPEVMAAGFIDGKPVIMYHMTPANHFYFLDTGLEEIRRLEEEYGKPCFLVTRGFPIEEIETYGQEDVGLAEAI